MSNNGHIRLNIRNRSRCPHCWQYFAPEDSLWISAHHDLTGDKRLGPEAQLRFLPSRFDVDGKAIDVKGRSCSELACPNCHLQIPRPVLEVLPLFVSIAGTPSCGKSYFLASMTWQMRRTLPTAFHIAFADADTMCNRMINDYEEQQFFNPDQNCLVKLAKTEEQGDLYSQVQFEDQVVTFPKPFLYAARPQSNHPGFLREREASRLVCLYDNAGESFLAGKDTVVSAVTRHLAVADAWLFCFDPTQDPRFRHDCKGLSEDIQITTAPVTSRQEPVFHEMVSRIRKHSEMSEMTRTDRPMIVLCNKYDAWWRLLKQERLPDPWKARGEANARLDMSLIRKVSSAVRNLLQKYSPEIVSNAESFSRNCFYLPASATGSGPERDPVTGAMGIRPRNIRPMWCDVPMLVIMAERAPLLVSRISKPSGTTSHA
jgi:hypothetical protein